MRSARGLCKEPLTEAGPERSLLTRSSMQINWMHCLGISKVPPTREEVKGKDNRRGEGMPRQAPGEGAGRVFQRLLCSSLLQVKAANSQGGPQDLASLSQLPGKVSKDQSPQPARSGHSFLLGSRRSAGP